MSTGGQINDRREIWTALRTNHGEQSKFTFGTAIRQGKESPLLIHVQTSRAMRLRVCDKALSWLDPRVVAIVYLVSRDIRFYSSVVAQVVSLGIVFRHAEGSYVSDHVRKTTVRGTENHLPENPCVEKRAATTRQTEITRGASGLIYVPRAKSH